MNKIFIAIGLLLFFPWMGFSQNTSVITLENCQQKAIENFPTNKQLGLNQSKHKLLIENIKKNYLPALNFNSQVSYQSDVTKVPSVPVPGFSMPSLSNDWYKFNLDIDQLIWDGGMTKKKQSLENYDYKIADQSVKVKNYQLKQQVNVLYFNMLFLRENIAVLHVLIDDLDARIKDANAALQNGMLLQADVDVLKVNKKQAEQQLIEKQEDLKGLVGAMQEITHLKISSANQLQVPQLKITDYQYVNNRPAYQLLSLQQNKFDALKSLTAAKRMPVFKAFGQAGYGRPGYDMLNPDFDTYYMVGIRLHWNIYDWGHVKHEKAILNVQRDIVKTEKQTFDQSLKADLQQRRAGIQKFEKLLTTDREILDLQKSVVKTANDKLKNGTITPTNYLIELNKQIKAQLNMEAHKLQLSFAKYQYITAIGNL